VQDPLLVHPPSTADGDVLVHVVGAEHDQRDLREASSVTRWAISRNTSCSVAPASKLSLDLGSCLKPPLTQQRLLVETGVLRGEGGDSGRDEPPSTALRVR
jgi:hypothetical protein